MNINTIWNSIIIIKIRRDDSYNFTLKEIEAFAQVYNIDLEDFCANVLKLSKQQIYNLRNGNNDFVKCAEYKRVKQEFFKEKSSSYRLQIIKEKIKVDFFNSFDIEELNKLSSKLGINLNDLCTNILGISRNMLNRLKNGEFKTVSSKKYETEKADYLNCINEDILAYILSSKGKTDFSSKFSYDEIMQYANKFGINIRDFLSENLGITDYGKRSRKPISKSDIYFSKKYKEFKHQRLQIKGDEILESFIAKRMQRTGDYRFDKDEIKTLSSTYHINVRDFMVYVLGKSEQLYYDLRADRIKECFSQKYKAKKEELIISKRENFMSEINPNIRTYYSWDELERLSSTLGISTYDLVVNVMEKSRQDFYRISNNYKNGKRVSLGEHKSGPLPNSYCKNNVEEILEILRIATRSAIGYMSSNGYKCARYYQDLLQEGYLYLASKGNPIDENGILSITSSIYEESHGSILYKKAYFHAISNIKSFCLGESTGEAYDVNIKTKGTTDEILDDEDTSLFIKNLSEDNCERQILKYFSENTFCDETMKEACKIFKVNSQYIQNLFAKLREKIFTQGISLDDE